MKWIAGSFLIVCLALEMPSIAQTLSDLVNTRIAQDQAQLIQINGQENRLTQQLNMFQQKQVNIQADIATYNSIFPEAQAADAQVAQTANMVASPAQPAPVGT